jgi:hypothetical protein
VYIERSVVCTLRAELRAKMGCKSMNTLGPHNQGFYPGRGSDFVFLHNLQTGPVFQSPPQCIREAALQRIILTGYQTDRLSIFSPGIRNACRNIPWSFSRKRLQFFVQTI